MRCTALPRRVLHERGEVVGRHDCPTCGSVVLELHRPGRQRIYCTNACRQRAYRWRRQHDVRHRVTRDGPAAMLCNQRLHAQRDQRDPVARLQDGRRRHSTVCGVFAKRLRSPLRVHNRFVPESPSSCASCVAAIGALRPEPPDPVRAAPARRPAANGD